MDITTSFFWQNVLLFALLTPYVVGIAVSAYYANRPQKPGGAKAQLPVMEKSTGEAKPTGRVIATVGATLLALVFSTTSVVAVVWAVVTLVGLPDFALWVLLVLGAIPVVWAALWTAGRAWHVEQHLEKGEDTDQPVFELGAYLPLPFLPRRHDHAK
ncbi:MAG: hypothetical protein ACREDW_04120 [Aestuariivirgaceae bacterium]